MTPYQISLELENVNVHCFDLRQYDPNTYQIDLTVFANYKGEIFYSGDITTEVHGFCVWDGNKWVPTKFLDLIKFRGINLISEYIAKRPKENEY